MPDLTLSPTPGNETPKTTETPLGQVSNADFLDTIFVDMRSDERTMVVGIKGAINDQTRWDAVPWTPDVDTSDARSNWYFTLSTYLPKDAAYRRKKSQFYRAFGVNLDDIGTKAHPRARLDACPPSYLIETSEGNYQAGYLFDVPVADLAQVETLQDQLIAANFCDSGAKGPSARLGRLPSGINGKYSPPHVCRLIEWHPERRYGIQDIVDGLQLKPLEVTVKGSKSRAASQSMGGNDEGDIYLPRASESPVLSALRSRGLYKQPLGDGAHDITCPWVHEHTASIDNGTAYFEPNDQYPVGGFKCHHSHGDKYRLRHLLEFLGVTFTEAKHKPVIRVTPGELSRIVDASEHLLAATGRHYQHGGLIVNVMPDPLTNDATIKPVNPNALLLSLSAGATWERYDGRTQEFVVTDPPAKYVNVLYDAPRYKELPLLRGIARQPYLRSDASVVTTAGFDSATGMFGVFDERQFSIPDSPDRNMAEQALAELKALLAEFKFANDHDLAAAIAMMITAAIRPALVAAPMCHVKAPQIASGKSYLCAVIAAFAGPKTPAASAFPTNDEECSKLLLSVLLESPGVVMFDNLTTDLHPFKSLCSSLTEEFLSGRILGVSKIATVSTRALFLSSGNNVDPVKDMSRRVVTITLDPACETPAARKFTSDPLGEVRDNRGKYVSLAMTIVLAYLAAGSPAQDLKPLGNYGDWNRLARAPLVWLGLSDPATAIFESMASDPDREALGRLLLAWQRVFGSSLTNIREVADKIDITGSINAELSEIVREIADERGSINRRRLGRWIARHQGRIVHGLKFVRDTPKGGSERWKVVSGVMGVSSSQDNKSVTSITTIPDDVEVL